MTIKHQDIYPVEPIRSRCIGSSGIELLPASPYSASYRPESHIIGFAFDTQTGIHAFGTDRRQDFQRQAHSFAFIPAGCDVFSESEQGGEYLKLSIVPELLSAIDCNEAITQVVTAKAVSIARKLRLSLIAGIEVEPLLLETLFDYLTPQLTPAKKNIRFPFTPKQLKRLDDFIDANIDQPLSVIKMAQTLDVSAGHFSRVFKASVGVSPFDYVIQRRLAYARYRTHRLYQSGSGLSEIAFASGFSSHSHMTMVFKKHLGLTPSELLVNNL
ncbi:MAG: helix-turn-helix domain-containing protein [Cellvibrionaceae bacterium]